MNNPNPFLPQGSLLEQSNKKRARVKVAVLTIFAVNILVIGPVLLNGGCKRDESTQSDSTTPTADNTPVATESNNATAMGTMQMSNSPTMSNAMPMTMTPAPTPAVVPVVSEATDYVVVKGDTFDSIAKSHNVKTKDLMAANPDIAPTKLAIGKKIKIPAASTQTASTSTASGSDDEYVVKSGDTLSKIATKYGTTYKAIMELNGLKTTQIKVGEKLKMPAKSMAAAPPAESMPAPTTTASNPSSLTPILR